MARGDHAEWSDIDLIVVSRDWEGMSMGERLSLLYRLWSAPRDATFVPLTPGELERRARESVVIREALAQGLELYPRPEGLAGEGEPAEGSVPGEGARDLRGELSRR